VPEVPRSPAPVAARPTLLTVDDDEGVREALHVILDDEFTVLDAPHGRAALGIVRTRLVDLVLLDILMPEVDGIEILQELRVAQPELPVIMMTAVKTVRTAVSAMKLGAADYITKPFDDRELLQAIRRALEPGARRPAEIHDGGRRESARRLPRTHRLLIVGTDPGWCAGVAVTLMTIGPVQTAPNLVEALTRLPGFRPTCVVLNLGRAVAEAPRFVAALVAQLPACRVVVVSEDVYLGATPAWEALNVNVVRSPVEAGELIERIGAVVASEDTAGTWPRLGGAVSRAIDHVSAHFRDDLKVDGLARIAGVSGSHLAHLFHAETGMTVRRYLTQVRVEVAKDLLGRTDEKLATVAAHVGFFDASHLARVFRKSTGRSPNAYRHAAGSVGPALLTAARQRTEA
jgi:FixJ family two-component response regulator/AraC-like DNA-binding protein